MTESDLFKLLKRRMPGVWMHRIENVIQPGCFDINALVDGQEVWLELKVFKTHLPPEKLGLRSSQINWVFQRLRNRGIKNLFVISVGTSKKTICIFHITGFLKKGVSGNSIFENIEEPNLEERFTKAVIDLLNEN